MKATRPINFDGVQNYQLHLIAREHDDYIPLVMNEAVKRFASGGMKNFEVRNLATMISSSPPMA